MVISIITYTLKQKFASGNLAALGGRAVACVSTTLTPTPAPTAAPTEYCIEHVDASLCGAGRVNLTATAAAQTLSLGGGYTCYAPNMQCEWLLRAEHAGDAVVVHFERFDMERHYDFVELYNGEVEGDSMLLASATGSDVPHEVLAPSGALLVRLRSDDSVGRHGFALNYHSVGGTNAPRPSASCTPMPSPGALCDLMACVMLSDSGMAISDGKLHFNYHESFFTCR